MSPLSPRQSRLLGMPGGEIPDAATLLAAPELADLALLVAVLDVVAAQLRAQHSLSALPRPHDSPSASAARDLIHRCRILRAAALAFRAQTLAELRDVANDDPLLLDPQLYLTDDDIPW